MRWRRRRRPPPSSLPLQPTEILHGVALFDQTYLAVPPFHIQWLHESANLSLVKLRATDTLTGAVVVFFDIGWPQMPGWVGSILDGTQRRVLLWNSSTASLDMFGPTGGWWGTSQVFTLMDEIGVANPVDRAIWEMMAKELTW